MLISRLDGHLSQSCDRRDQRDQTTLTPAQWSVRHCVYSIYTQATDVDDLTWSCYTGGEKPRSVSDEIINNVNELSASSSARTLTQPQTSNLQCFHFTTILQHNAVRVKFSNKIEHCKETLPKSQVLSRTVRPTRWCHLYTLYMRYISYSVPNTILCSDLSVKMQILMPFGHRHRPTVDLTAISQTL